VYIQAKSFYLMKNALMKMLENVYAVSANALMQLGRSPKSSLPIANTRSNAMHCEQPLTIPSQLHPSGTNAAASDSLLGIAIFGYGFMAAYSVGLYWLVS
jgi:hypothetical protein